MMAGDLDPVRIYPQRTQPDAIAALDGIRADAVRVGKQLADLRAAARDFPLLQHHFEAQVYRHMAAIGCIDGQLEQLRGGQK